MCGNIYIYIYIYIYIICNFDLINVMVGGGAYI